MSERMNVTMSMWLGVTFVVLAIVSVLLQAWLWNPKYWDPIAKKSHAPPFWMAVHRITGYLYAAIYIVMMYYMVPRLWEYQVELPARTVIHAVAAITIGVVLFTKILILRFFRYFEEAMPVLGMVLLICTILLGSLSLPFAFRAHGNSDVLTQENRDRVLRILTSMRLPEDARAEQLSTVSSLEQGREVLVRKCTLCHDLRTILAEPRTGEGWFSLCRRMQGKPTLGAPLTDRDVHVATAYLIAITPTLQDDVQRRREEEEEREGVVEDLDLELAAPTEASPSNESDGGVPNSGLTTQSAETSSAPSTRSSVDAPPPLPESESPRASSESTSSRRRRNRRHRSTRRTSAEASAASVPTPSATAAQNEASSASLAYSPALARQILQRACTDCHGLSDIDEHGGDDRTGWAAVVRRMIREGAELTSDEARVLVTYLASRYPSN